MTNLDTDFEAELKGHSPAPVPPEMTARLHAARRDFLEQRGSGVDWSEFFRVFFSRPELGWAVAAVLAVLLAARPGPASTPPQPSGTLGRSPLAAAEPPVRLMLGSEPVDVVKGRNGELARRYRVSYLDPHQNALNGMTNPIPREEMILVPVSLY